MSSNFVYKMSKTLMLYYDYTLSEEFLVGYYGLLLMFVMLIHNYLRE
jgi:hypothetical protein